MHITGAACRLAILIVAAATFSPPSAHADAITFLDRISFGQALDREPTLVKTVEGWDTHAAGTVFPNGGTANGITYNVSTGEALVVSTGVSLSPPHNLFQTASPTAGTSRFRPLVDTFTFGFDEPILAFGITFSSTFAVEDGDYLLTTDRGHVVASFFDPLFPGFPLGQFAGFISDQPFNRVTVSSTANALYGMDDLTFARSVPEPSPVTLFGAGLLGLVVLQIAGRARSSRTPHRPC